MPVCGQTPRSAPTVQYVLNVVQPMQPVGGEQCLYPWEAR